MIRRRILQFICVAVLGLVLFDSTIDAAGCNDSKATATPCHSCMCGPHLVSAGVIEVAVVPVAVPHVSYKPAPYAFLLRASIFHPPCLAA